MADFNDWRMSVYDTRRRLSLIRSDARVLGRRLEVSRQMSAMSWVSKESFGSGLNDCEDRDMFFWGKLLRNPQTLRLSWQSANPVNPGSIPGARACPPAR